MRLFPVVTAALVCVALFFVVLQREALMGFARSFGDEAETAAEASPAPEVSPVAIAEVEAAQAREAVHVIALRSEAREVPDAVMVRGQSAAAREVEVRAETTGTVVSEPLRAGAFVEAGQLLCEIDPGSRVASLSEAQARLAAARAAVPEAEARVPEGQARVAEAEARLEEARINQNAASRLSEGGFASDTRVANAAAALRAAEAALTAAATGLESVTAGIEATRANVQTAEAAVEQAELEIDKLSIRAPFAGLLETDTAELGALLQEGSACATVIQLDPMKLVGFLPEAQVDRVTVGAEAGARLASGGEAQGRVTFLSRSADDVTRTFRVEVTVPNPELAIRDGQTVEMVIRTEPARAHLLPASALTLDDDGRLGLRVIEDGIVGFLPATLIRDTPRGVLLGDLPEAADVIVVGQEYVTDGVPVDATYESIEALASRPEATQ
jgi:multidrug efflux system membrane fusion protein